MADHQVQSIRQSRGSYRYRVEVLRRLCGCPHLLPHRLLPHDP